MFRKMISQFCFVLAITIPSAISVGQPSNNDCQDAVSVGEVMNLEFDTRGATFDGPGHYVYGPNIWYRYTASCTGNVTVSLSGSDFDTELAIYNGGDCNPASSDLIEANNNFGTSLQSQITFAAIASNKYLIEIGGHNSAVNTGLLSITCAGQSGPSAVKDKCSNTQPGGNVTDLPFDTRTATFDGPGLCVTSPNMWYRYTATCTGDATVSLLGSSYDTKLAVYDGGECNPTSGRLIECNDDFGSGYQSEVTFAAIAGSQYLVEIGGYGSATGEGVLNISCVGQSGPPSSQDDCTGAKPIGDVTDLAFNTTDATFDGPGHCMTSPNIWYSYTASCTGDVTVSLLGSSYDTMLAVYEGSTCYPTAGNLIECNDDSGSAYQSEITFAAVSGSQYLIEVGGYGSAKGQGILNVSCQGQVIVSSKTDLGDAPDSTNNPGNPMLTSRNPV
ncbi:MAG: PPC domain-containing protein, partial [Planctomycetota bacterium]